VIEELARELAAVGIRGRLRRRILAEVGDHLAADPGAPLGDPKVLAAQFAEVAGGGAATRAARGSFAALVLAGAVFAVAFRQLSASTHDVSDGGLAAAVGALVLPQVSFVGGILAPLARTPRHAVRRAALGLVAGAGSLGCVYALGWTRPAPLVAAGAALAVAAVLVARAARFRVPGAGPEIVLTWRQGLALTLLAAVAVGIAGASGGDPGEGLRNALGETVAAMSGFAVSGKYLGLRR